MYLFVPSSCQKVKYITSRSENIVIQVQPSPRLRFKDFFSQANRFVTNQQVETKSVDKDSRSLLYRPNIVGPGVITFCYPPTVSLQRPQGEECLKSERDVPVDGRTKSPPTFRDRYGLHRSSSVGRFLG